MIILLLLLLLVVVVVVFVVFVVEKINSIKKMWILYMYILICVINHNYIYLNIYITSHNLVRRCKGVCEKPLAIAEKEKKLFNVYKIVAISIKCLRVLILSSCF